MNLPDEQPLESDKPGDEDEHQPGRNNALYWVTCEVGTEHQPLASSQVVLEHGVPKRVFLAYLRDQIEEESAVTSLPFALLLVLWYFLMFQNVDKPAVVQGMQEALMTSIEENAVFGFALVDGSGMGHKNVYDVHTAADFWSWIRLGLAPLMFPSERGTSEESSLSLGNMTSFERQNYLNYNLKVGAVRLRQETSEFVSCPNAQLEALYTLRCSTSSSLDLDLEPVEQDVSKSTFTEASSLTQWFRFQGGGSSLADTQARMLDLEKQHWFNNRTLRAEVSFIVYNGNIDSLTLLNIHFLVSRTGRFWKQLTCVSLFMLNSNSPWSYIFDFLFYGHITAIFLVELREVVQACRRHSLVVRKCLKDYVAIWNIIDWTSILVGYLMFSLWVVIRWRVQSLSDSLLILHEQDSACKVSNSDCKYELIASFYIDLENAKPLIVAYELIAALYPFVLVLRLFKAFSSQPRLALVTQTLARATDAVFHFGIVVMAIFGSYCIMGSVLFGRHMEDFATLDRSMLTCFRFLLGDFEFSEMEGIGRPMTSIYLGSYLLFMLFVLMNMFIAIIMSAYEAVKQATNASQTLFKQSSNILRATYQQWQGKTLPLDIVRRHAEETTFRRTILVANLTESVPNLSEEQAKNLLETSTQVWRDKHKTEGSLRHLLDMLIRMRSKKKNAHIDGNCNMDDSEHPVVEEPSVANSLLNGIVGSDVYSAFGNVPLLTLLTTIRCRIEAETEKGTNSAAIIGALLTAERLCMEY